MILGVDPGKKGGLALLTARGEVVFAIQLPHAVGLVHELEQMASMEPKLSFVFVEKAQAFPGQGVSGMFNYGVGFGEIIGILTALKLPYELVPPITWTREMLAGTPMPRSSEKKVKKDKTRNIEAARRLFPSHEEMRKLKVHEGIVDALLIAEWGRRRRYHP